MKVVFEDEHGTGVFYFDTMIDSIDEIGVMTFINRTLCKCINLDYKQILEVRKEYYHKKTFV